MATVRYPFADAGGDRVLLYAAILLGDAGHAGSTALDTLLELKEELRRAERNMATDRLTGALSRAWLEDQARNELVRLQRYGHPVSVLFMDLDGLKRVNDTQGHRAGDAYLRRFCAEVVAASRGSDRLGRLGGDEFLLLLPNTPLAGAEHFAGRIRDRLRAAQREAIAPAASIGVATAQANESWESLLERADAAMYRAKRRGANEIESDRPPQRAAIAAAGTTVDQAFLHLVWQPAYASGDATLDAQHRGLFDLASALLAAVANERPADETLPLVDRLVVDVRTHFAFEEAILERIGFPHAAQHREGHARLLARAVQLAASVRDGVVPLATALEFLVHQLIGQHLLKADRAFFAYLGRGAFLEAAE